MSATATLEAPPVAWDVDATVPRDELLTALRLVRYAIGGRPPVPVLACVFVSAGPDCLTLVGFDYEVHARVTIPADCTGGETGALVVGAGLLAGVLTVLPKGCTVRLTVDGEHLRVHGDGATYRLPLGPVADYPADRTLTDGTRLLAELPAQGLRQLRRVVLAAGRDDTLPVLTAVSIDTDDAGHLVAAAADRYRLAVSGTGIPADLKSPLLIPARHLDFAARFFPDEPVQLYADNDGHIGLVAEERSLVVRRIDGEYPRWRSLLPETSPITAEVNTAELLSALVQTAVVAERNTPVRLSFSSSAGTVLCAAGNGDASSAEKQATCSVNEDITVGFNPGYLIGGLRACGGDTTRIAMQAPGRPALLTDPTDPGFTYLLMPIRTSEVRS